MLVIRYAPEGLDEAVVGVRADDGTVRRADAGRLEDLLSRTAAEFRSAVEHIAAAGPVEDRPVRLLPPVDGRTEVWAAGVTYQRSSDARQEESQVADVYARVYDAPRPELFFKSVAWRTCGHDEPIGVRGDSEVDVPEPELALVCNAHQEVVGLTICNDVSSRSIE